MHPEAEFRNRSIDRTRRVLILGGTGEASEFAARLSEWPGWIVISSLAGRVSQPAMPAGLVRVGGFGGVAGLIKYLAEERIDAVLDATHPFAVQISRNAELACGQSGVPLIAFERPAWVPQAGDCWISALDVESAAQLVNHRQNRVLLAVGRQELSAFSDCRDAWFLVRTIDEPAVPLPERSRLLLSRGPFRLDQERLLLQREAITHIVSKNSGGTATYAKIEAARERGLPIIMIARPIAAGRAILSHADEVYLQLRQLLSKAKETT